ncbi:unnamed protein product, partial [Protopolystoma xenopodis]
MRGHTESVDQLAWHPSSYDTLVSVGADGVVRLWDCRMKKGPVTAQLKGENINVAWSPNGRTIAVGNKGDLVSWLDVRAGLKVIQHEQFNCEINEFEWRPSGDSFFLTTGAGGLLIYTCVALILCYTTHFSGKPGDMKRELTLHAHPVNAMCFHFSPNGDYFAVGSADALVSIWDANELI